jgi:hypothetical protein
MSALFCIATAFRLIPRQLSMIVFVILIHSFIDITNTNSQIKPEINIKNVFIFSIILTGICGIYGPDLLESGINIGISLIIGLIIYYTMFHMEIISLEKLKSFVIENINIIANFGRLQQQHEEEQQQ